MERQIIQLVVNGDRYDVATVPWRTLAEVLREDLGLVGTKIGCNNGDCGACTVLFDGVTVCSCLMLVGEAVGHEITTIEGVAPSPQTLHPIQKAFVEKGGVQCGFCTSGMILSAQQLLARNNAPTEQQVRQGLSGNLCRCTGYNKIVEAIQTAASAMAQRDGE